MTTNDTQALTERLQKENQYLTAQVRRLIQTEKDFQRSQETLNGQVRLYRRLYEVGTRLNETFDLQDVLKMATQFITTDLNFELCVVMLHGVDSDDLHVVAHEGYTDPDHEDCVDVLHLSLSTPALVGLLTHEEQITYDQNVADADLYALSRAWCMDEFVAVSLGNWPTGAPMGLVVAGNSAARALYLTEVETEGEVVLGLANLVSQLATVINNVYSYLALEEERQTLEVRVAERTADLATAKTQIEGLNQMLTAENRRMSSELDVTRRLQKMILPRDEELENVADLDIAAYMEPADEVGGDYYDVLQQNGRVKIGIGDVTGHGLESGILMTMVQMAVRTLLAAGQTDLSTFLPVINRAVFANVARMQSDRNLTLMLLDYADGVLRVTGQHEEVLIIRADGNVEQIDTINLGFPIGLTDEIGDFINYTDVPIGHEDVVILYSDGIPEAENVQHQLYGIERLIDVVQTNRNYEAEEIERRIMSSVRQFIGVQKVFDDITLLVIKRK